MSARKWMPIFMIVAWGCVGQAPPPVDQANPDAGVDLPQADAAIEADAEPPAPTTLDVTGVARDYWNNEPLSDVTATTDGIDPGISGGSDELGEYSLVDVPATSAFYVRTSRAAGYRVTVNEPVFVADVSVAQDLFVVSAADAQRQHVTAGLAVEPDTAIVIVDMLLANDTPMVGVTAEFITLTDDGGIAVGAGPYFLGELNDVDLALTESTTFGGRARVAFLNVPAGFATLIANHPVDGAVTETVLVRPAGAHLVRLGGLGDDAPVPAAPRFETDVYEILQSAASGGSGCSNCHRLGGPSAAAVFRFDDTVAVVYQAVMDRVGVIDLVAPELSLLLTAPLYDDPPNHPNATWLDTTTPEYQTILLWIQQGAGQ